MTYGQGGRMKLSLSIQIECLLPKKLLKQHSCEFTYMCLYVCLSLSARECKGTYVQIRVRMQAPYVSSINPIRYEKAYGSATICHRHVDMPIYHHPREPITIVCRPNTCQCVCILAWVSMSACVCICMRVCANIYCIYID